MSQKKQRARQPDSAEVQQLRRQKQILDCLHEAVITSNLDGIITEWSKGAERLWGYTAKEALGRHLDFLANPLQEITPEETVLQLLKQGGHYDKSSRLMTKSGEPFTGRLSMSLLVSGADEPEGFIAVVSDITASKKSERDLRKSEERFRHVFHEAPMGMAMLTADGQFLTANHAFCTMLGYSVEELAERTFRDITHPDDLESSSEIHAGASDRPESFFQIEKRYVTKSGETIWAHLTSSAIKGEPDAPQYTIAMVENITARKRGEEALRESEARMRMLANASPSLICYVGKDRLYRFVNKTYADWYTRDVDEIVGMSVRELHGEAEYEHLRPSMELVLSGQEVGFEVDLDDLVSGARSIQGTLVPNFDQQGNVEGYFVFTSDVTDLKVRERELHQAQKMEAVGQLTGGVAHEFNNLLMVILGNIEILDARLAKDDTLQTYVSAALKGVQRGAELTQSLLAFSRKQRLKAGRVDLNKLVRNMHDLLRRTLGETITLEADLAGDLWDVTADPGQIESALLNFVLNARDAMPRGGCITLRTANREITEAADGQKGITPGDYVTLEVGDTGTGMTGDQAEHAFEPFYTTKEVGKGTGLGLSVAYGFAMQSGGCLEIASELGQGTIVRLSLPRAARPAAMAKAPEPAGPASRSGRILVVEDDAEVRTLVAHQLAEFGYQVLEAGNGQQALALLDEHPDVDLLFADVVLPGGMSGPETASLAQVRQPGIKVILTSGYPEKETKDLQVNGKDIKILRKPYRKSVLAEAVAAAWTAD